MAGKSAGQRRGTRRVKGRESGGFGGGSLEQPRQWPASPPGPSPAPPPATTGCQLAPPQAETPAPLPRLSRASPTNLLKPQPLGPPPRLSRASPAPTQAPTARASSSRLLKPPPQAWQPGGSGWLGARGPTKAPGPAKALPRPCQGGTLSLLRHSPAIRIGTPPWRPSVVCPAVLATW